MNKEYLVDYHQREQNLFDTFLKDIYANNLDELSQYPPLGRFPKAKSPLACAHPLLSNIYSIIPFYGTTIIYISPNKKSMFQAQNGFSPEDIDKLVDFAKETGKIHFILSTHPIFYEGLDFLDPLFTELSIPESFLLPLDIFADKKQISRLKVEYQTIATLGFMQYIISEYSRAGFSLFSAVKHYYEDAAIQYAFAKMLGHDDLTKLLEEKMLERDFKSVEGLVGIIAHFINSKRVPLSGIQNYSKDFLSIMRSGIKSDNISPQEYQPTSGIPFDIGRFLIRNKKLTNASGDFGVCKELCDHYRQSDLHKLLVNLQCGIDDQDIDVINSTKEELDDSLENLWSNAGYIRKRANILKAGIPFSIGLIGKLAEIAVSANENLGILASLGYLAIDKIVGAKSTGLSERLAKFGQKNYLVGIYDFKKKLPKTIN